MDIIWLAAFLVFDRGVKMGERVFAQKTGIYKRYKNDCDAADQEKDEIERTRQSGVLKLSRTRELFETQKRIEALNKEKNKQKTSLKNTFIKDVNRAKNQTLDKAFEKVWIDILNK